MLSIAHVIFGPLLMQYRGRMIIPRGGIIGQFSSFLRFLEIGIIVRSVLQVDMGIWMELWFRNDVSFINLYARLLQFGRN